MKEGFYEKYWSGADEKRLDFNIKWPKLKKFIPLEKETIILDFGCGNGAILREMALINPEAKYVGVDVSETALEAAKKSFPLAAFYKISDIEKTPLENQSVDFIFSSEVLEHIFNVENAFSEFKRVLKPGGKILLTVPYHGFIKNILIAIFAFNNHFNPASSHIRFFSKKTLFDLLNKFGFGVIKYGYYGRFYPIPHSIWVLGEREYEK